MTRVTRCPSGLWFGARSRSPSNGDGFFGHCLVDMMKLGTHIISIDPRITWVGAHDGNINLQVRPQTDTALALGLSQPPLPRMMSTITSSSRNGLWR